MLAMAAWLAGVAFFLHVEWSWASTPGPRGEAPARWPIESRLQRTPGRATLLVFATPDCDCTRATLASLEPLLADHAEVDARLVMVRQGEGGEAWARAQQELAGALPAARRELDEGGVESIRFGAATSGTVMLYGPDGALRFRGGVTASRGHLGENAALDALRSLLSGGTSSQRDFAVFGCALRSGSGETTALGENR